MFALFEADSSIIRCDFKPQVTSLRSLPGANQIGPLRGPPQPESERTENNY